MPDDIAARAELARSIAGEAAALAMTFWRRAGALEVKAKGLRDYVTAADIAIEKLICERVAAAFSGDGFLGEEGGGTAAPCLWVVDPIDGTGNFARGLPHFAISIAFCLDGQPVIGAVAEPATGDIYTARRGGGACKNGAPIRASAANDLAHSLVEFGYAEPCSAAENLALMRRMVEAGCDVRLIGSAALGLARVAEGRSDGYCELYLRSWDVLAGMLLVAEAGGRTNDFLAGNGLTKGNPMLAAAAGVAVELGKAMGVAPA
ncbi:MAG: inositol monophosphatase family protein [Rhodospirillales bacterium]